MHICADEVVAVVMSLPFIGLGVVKVRMFFKGALQWALIALWVLFSVLA